MKLRAELAGRDDKIRSLRTVLHAHEQKQECEDLYARGHIYDAAKSLIELSSIADEAVRTNKCIRTWLTGEFQYRTSTSSLTLPLGFMDRCISTLEKTGDNASESGKHDEAVLAYFTASSLSSSTPDTLLTKWARTVLTHGSSDDALAMVTKVCST